MLSCSSPLGLVMPVHPVMFPIEKLAVAMSLASNDPLVTMFEP